MKIKGRQRSVGYSIENSNLIANNQLSLMNHNRSPQHAATIHGLEKGMAKFVESASIKIEQLEKMVEELKNKPNSESKKLNHIESNHSFLSSEVELLKTAMKEIKIKDLNKYVLYKEQEVQRIQLIEKTLTSLELKVTSVDSFVKRLQVNLSRLQENIAQNNLQILHKVQEQNLSVENQIKYLIQKQIEHVRGINPDLNELRRVIQCNANEIGTIKSVLKELNRSMLSQDNRVKILQQIPGEIQEVKRFLATKLKQFEDSNIDASIASVHERLIEPFKEVHRRQLAALGDKIDTIVKTTSTVKDEIIGLLTSSEEIADRRYEETSKAIMEICRILKVANPVF